MRSRRTSRDSKLSQPKKLTKWQRSGWSSQTCIVCCAGIYPQVYNSIYTLVHLLRVGEAAPYPYSVIGQRCALQFGGVEVIIPLQIKQETPSTNTYICNLISLRRPTPPPTSAVLTTDNDNGWIIILHHIIRTYSMYSAAISMPLTEGQQHFQQPQPA